jgi:hypothetical protein
LVPEDNGRGLVKIEQGCDPIGIMLGSKIITKFFSLCGLPTSHLTTLGTNVSFFLTWANQSTTAIFFTFAWFSSLPT